MLVPSPCQVPIREDNKESEGVKGSLGGTPNTVSGEINAPFSEDKREGEVVLSPHSKKRAASKVWEAKAPKRGKTPLLGGSGSEGDVVAHFL